MRAEVWKKSGQKRLKSKIIEHKFEKRKIAKTEMFAKVSSVTKSGTLDWQNLFWEFAKSCKLFKFCTVRRLQVFSNLRKNVASKTSLESLSHFPSGRIRF